MRSEKEYLVKQISDMIGSSDYIYFVSFGGMTVKEMSEVRTLLAGQNAALRVLKNAWIKKAAAALNIEVLVNDGALTLGTAMVYGKGDAGAVAKVLQEYGKKNEKMASKGGYLDGALLSAAEVGDLAKLPSKQVLQAMLLGVLQAPSRNLVTVLNAKAASILNVLNAYKDKVENSSK